MCHVFLQWIRLLYFSEAQVAHQYVVNQMALHMQKMQNTINYLLSVIQQNQPVAGAAQVGQQPQLTQPTQLAQPPQVPQQLQPQQTPTQHEQSGEGN